jgi:hypothetical protein
MTTGFQLALQATVGALAGAVGGAVAGWIGGFLERYLLHPLAPLVNYRARIAVATGNVPAFAKMAGLAGLVTGGVTGGSRSLAIGLVAAAALALTASAGFRWVLQRSADFRGMEWAVIFGAGAGAVAGYFGGLLVNAG